jgi:hypothetical protein
MKGDFSQVRRAGFDIGLSAGKLTKAMVEVLSQLPPEGDALEGGRRAAPRPPRADVQDPRHQRCLERRQAPSRARALRQVLCRRQGPAFGISEGGCPREKLSTAGHRKLAALAAKEGVTPDELLSRLISSWRRAGS